MRRTLIVNPGASRVTEERIAEVEARLRPDETMRTERRGHATELARIAAGDEVWVLGGDGVVNEVLNGLRVGAALGIVPAGHTNVLARALGRSRRITVGRVNGRRFAFSAGIGVDSEAVRAMETEKRVRDGRRPGDLAYAAEITRRLMRGYEPRLEVVGMGKAAIAFVANDAVYTYAGPLPLRFAPKARFELGLDLVAPERVTPASAALLAARLVIGRGLAGAAGVMFGHDLDVIEVHCDVPLPLQADGEDLGDVREAVFEAERDAVTVLVSDRTYFRQTAARSR
jgi:diacylglycerol kinase family enzyme